MADSVFSDEMQERMFNYILANYVPADFLGTTNLDIASIVNAIRRAGLPGKLSLVSIDISLIENLASCAGLFLTMDMNQQQKWFKNDTDCIGRRLLESFMRWIAIAISKGNVKSRGNIHWLQCFQIPDWYFEAVRQNFKFDELYIE